MTPEEQRRGEGLDELLHAMGSGADDEPAIEGAAVRVQDEAPGGSDERSDGYVSDQDLR